MNRRMLVATATTMVALFVLSAAALAVTETATSGHVKASFSYAVKKSNGFPTFSHEQLTITRDGVAHNLTVSDPACAPCAPLNYYGKKSSVQVVDINHTGEPNVVLGLFSGGAHCCVIAQVFTYSASQNSYVKLRHDFADPGYTLKRLTPQGDDRFVSANPYFEYVFDSYAQSGDPIQIWGISGGAFVDVTRSYPALITKDAARWWKLFLRNYKSGGEGAFAPWAADEEMLGHDALVQTTLKQQAAAGHFVNNTPGKNGIKFAGQLNALLVKLGYKH